MSSEITGFKPEEILASGTDENGLMRSILVENSISSQELDYIPPRLHFCGKTEDGKYYKIKLNTSGSFVF